MHTRRLATRRAYHWDTLVTRPTVLLEEKNPGERLRYKLLWAKSRREVRDVISAVEAEGGVGLTFKRPFTANDWAQSLEKLSQTPPQPDMAGRDALLFESVIDRFLALAGPARDNPTSTQQLQTIASPAAAMLSIGRLIAETRNAAPAGPFTKKTDAALKLLLGECIERVDQLSGFEVVALLQGCAMGGVSPGRRAVLRLLGRVVEDDCLPQIVCPDVAYLMHAMLTLHEKTDPREQSGLRGEFEPVVEALGGHACARLAGTFTPLHIAECLHAMASIGVSHDGLVQVLAERSLSPHVLGSFTGTQAGLAVHALSLLQPAGPRILPTSKPTHGILPATGTTIVLPRLSDARASQNYVPAWSPKDNWVTESVTKQYVEEPDEFEAASLGTSGETGGSEEQDGSLSASPVGRVYDYQDTETVSVWSVQRLLAHSLVRHVLAQRRPVTARGACLLLKGCSAMGYHHPLRTPALEEVALARLRAPGGAARVEPGWSGLTGNPLTGRAMALRSVQLERGDEPAAEQTPLRLLEAHCRWAPRVGPVLPECLRLAAAGERLALCAPAQGPPAPCIWERNGVAVHPAAEAGGQLADFADRPVFPAEELAKLKADQPTGGRPKSRSIRASAKRASSVLRLVSRSLPPAGVPAETAEDLTTDRSGIDLHETRSEVMRVLSQLASLRVLHAGPCLLRQRAAEGLLLSEVVMQIDGVALLRNGAGCVLVAVPDPSQHPCAYPPAAGEAGSGKRREYALLFRAACKGAAVPLVVDPELWPRGGADDAKRAHLLDLLAAAPPAPLESPAPSALPAPSAPPALPRAVRRPKSVRVKRSKKSAAKAAEA
ncbi:hypothetical protein DIPPA_23652 [Diplonema papillatum]|nr:hypothetical protein DIPPA_23652 [Diplonema papillatum]